MKKIIRLTESDLARIVRRVIMEQVKGTGTKTDPYKLKVFSSENDKIMGQVTTNWDVYDLTIKGSDVEFKYKEAGSTAEKEKGNYFNCNTKETRYSTFDNNLKYSFYALFTDEATKIFQEKCDEYALNKTNNIGGTSA